MSIARPCLPERLLLTLFSHSDYVAHLDGFTIIPGGWLNGHYIQLAYQLADSVSGFTYSFGGTCIILSVMNLIPGLSLRASEQAEIHGIDEAEIGEFAVCPMISILSSGPHTNHLSLLVWLCRERARIRPRRSKPSGTQSREIFPGPRQIRWCVISLDWNLPPVLFCIVHTYIFPMRLRFMFGFEMISLNAQGVNRFRGIWGLWSSAVCIYKLGSI